MPHFPRETDRIYTVTNFVQQQPQNQVATEPSNSPRSPSPILSKLTQTPLSPSVYSRNTDGMSILPNDSVLSFSGPYEYGRAHNGGSAVILNSQSVRRHVIGTPSPNRPSSSRSSRDWKAWLSREVSGIETISQEEPTIHQQIGTTSVRHGHETIHTVHTSQTGSEDTTVIVRESFEAPTPRAQAGKTSVDATHSASSVATPSVKLNTSSKMSKNMDGHRTTRKAGSPPGTPVTEIESRDKSHDMDVSTPHTQRDCPTVTPGHESCTTASPLCTPGSAHMNDRFPFLSTGKRSSSHNSNLSRQSKSPTSSTGSSSKSQISASMPVIYSDFSAPANSSAMQHFAGTATRKVEIPQQSKENITPPSIGGHRRPHMSPLGLVSRPKSLQPLSSTALNRSANSVAQHTTHEKHEALSKHNSGPLQSPLARPRLRAIIRPLSPDKLSRRPRSAFDLRNTPSPRPASEVRRPALQSSRSIACELGAGPSLELGVCDAMMDPDERDGSVTPGQRMADRFLEERKISTVLERGVKKSTSKFVREDTPAFL